MPELTISLALRIVACFFLGSIPFAILSMLGSGIDIRTVGSGNPGFNNVLRVSKSRAVICLAGDLGKGILAILLFYRPADPVSVAWILGMAVMLGHCYSPFLKFNGGKGVATSTGVMLVLYPLLAVPCICAYVIFRIIGRKVFHWAEEGAISSLASWALFVVLIEITRGPHETVYAAAMFLIVVWRHRANLRKLSGVRA